MNQMTTPPGARTASGARCPTASSVRAEPVARTDTRNGRAAFCAAAISRSSAAESDGANTASLPTMSLNCVGSAASPIRSASPAGISTRPSARTTIASAGPCSASASNRPRACATATAAIRARSPTNNIAAPAQTSNAVTAPAIVAAAWVISITLAHHLS